MVARASLKQRQRRGVEAAVRRAAKGKRLVLAVSGGRDSMGLLHATARVARRNVVAVATFDHATGAAATNAAALVATAALELRLPAVIGRAAVPAESEAAWREQRRAFLTDVAGTTRGAVATAHTLDDQVETILMRVLRGAGARGLAGLFAETEIIRPLLFCTRAEVAAYAEQVGAAWIEDPTNASMRFLRNRVRRDLLPALTSARPDLPFELLDLAERAAHWRRELDAVLSSVGRVGPDGASLAVAVEDLQGYSRAELAVVWPALAARVGLAMDWRGTERAAAFTRDGRAGARIQLAGGWEISRTKNRFELALARNMPQTGDARELASDTQWGEWRFHVARGADGSRDPWVAQLPAHAVLTVRRWQPGDRMRVGAGGLRKVKRFLSDAQVSGIRRQWWPVVLAGDEIVWIPGVSRSDAAAVRPGRPGVLIRCELDDD